VVIVGLEGLFKASREKSRPDECRNPEKKKPVSFERFKAVIEG